MVQQTEAQYTGKYGQYADLKGKRILVTGGSAGIGKAAALAFGANGARVAVMGRRKERLDSVVDQLPGGLAVVGDLTIPEDCQRAIEETVAAFGGLDILVNNGATATAEQNANLTEPKGYQEAFNLHIVSLLHLVKAAEQELIKTKGNIVNVSSAVAKSTPDSPLMMGYMVAKAAQQKLTEGWARQYAPQGVRVNSILPAWTYTESTESLAQMFGKPIDEVLVSMGHIHALDRISYADEVAAGILFLGSDAASFVTGMELLMDGGARLMGKVLPDIFRG